MATTMNPIRKPRRSDEPTRASRLAATGGTLDQANFKEPSPTADFAKGLVTTPDLPHPIAAVRSTGRPSAVFAPEELPLTVREAAIYLGVSVQTVYLWVERKQIPHLRVMGRNIRFLKSDLRPFRATFKQEVGNGKTE
jgi:excisionase family DNA binding protein